MPPNKWFGTAINDYPGAPLKGCVADRQTIKGDLGGRFNAVGWEWRSAINATAKKQQILDGLKWLGTGPAGITRVISKSGHGTPQIRNGTLQTVFCAVNFDWTEKGSVFAHEVLEIIGNYPKGKLLIVWDSCYSEWDSDDGMKGLLGNFTESMREVSPRSYPISGQPDIQELHQKALIQEDPLSKAIESGAIECCYIPACLTKGAHSKDGETAADVRVGSQAYGAHTHQLSKVWNEVALTTTLEKVVSQQRTELEVDGYNQHSFAQGVQKNLTLKEMFGL